MNPPSINIIQNEGVFGGGFDHAVNSKAQITWVSVTSLGFFTQ